jgi:hypothetical protein
MHDNDAQFAVILDKSFLQGESRESPRLRALSKAGARFVLTDTLIYELCTSSPPGDWGTSQKKLFPFYDRIELWYHVDDLLDFEVQNRKAAETPINAPVTERLQQQFASQQVYVPPDLQATARPYIEVRERENVRQLIQDCRSFCGCHPDYAKRVIRNSPVEREVVAALMREERFFNFMLRQNFGDATDRNHYIAGAEHGLPPNWFAHHYTKSLMALLGTFLLKYGLANPPSKDFAHTKLDADYIALLSYADALGTNETSGSMSVMCDWLYGDAKAVFATSDVDACAPREAEIRDKAYRIWAEYGRSHGHDISDWLGAEDILSKDLWRRLAERASANPQNI